MDWYFRYIRARESCCRWLVNKVPYPLNHDIWLRYAKPEHVEQWSKLLAEWMPQCVEDFEKSDTASP